MIDTLSLIAAILAVAAAITAGHGAILAKPSKPDLGENLRGLTTIVSETFSGTSIHLSGLRERLGCENVSPQEAMSSAVLAIENLSIVYERVHDRIREFSVRDFSKSEMKALRAQFWIQIGTCLAVSSAALQLIVLYLRLSGGA